MNKKEQSKQKKKGFGSGADVTEIKGGMDYE